MDSQTEKPKNCFVAMPFRLRPEYQEKYNNDNSHWDEVFHGLIAPAATQCGLVCTRDDHDSTPRIVAEQIWRKIEEADLIVCDLSSYNPNVHLELGWTLRANKKFVLIKDKLTSYTFDLNQLYIVEYDHSLRPKRLAEDVSELSNAIQNALTDEEKLYSMTARLALSTEIQRNSNETVETQLLRHVSSRIDRIEKAFSTETRSEFNFQQNNTVHNVEFEIDFPTLKKNVSTEIDSNHTIGDILDFLFFQLDDLVTPYHYMTEWILEESVTGLPMTIWEYCYQLPALPVFSNKSRWVAHPIEAPYCRPPRTGLAITQRGIL